MDLQNDLLSLETDFSWERELDFQKQSNQIPSSVLNNYLKKKLEDSQKLNTKYYNLNESENQLEEYLIKFGVQRLLNDFNAEKQLLDSPLEEKEFDLQQLYEEDNMSTNECSAELMNLKNYQQQQQNTNEDELQLEKQDTRKIGDTEKIQEVEENEESEDYEDSEYTSEQCQQQYQKQTPQQYQQEINQQLNQQQQEQLNYNQSSQLEEEQSQSESIIQNQNSQIQQNQIQNQQMFDEESETLQSEEMATTTLNFNSISCNPASSTDSILQQQLAINQQNLQQESSSIAISEQQQLSSNLQISSTPQYEESSSEYVPKNQKKLRRSQRQTEKKSYTKKEKLQNLQKSLKKELKKSQKQQQIFKNEEVPKIQNKAIKKRDITLNYKNKRSSEETKNLPTTIGKILLKSLKDHLPDIQELQNMEAISNKDHFQQLFKISPIVQRYSIDFLTKGPMMAYLASSTRLKQKRLVIKYIDIIVEGAIDPYNFKCFKQQPTY